LRKAEGVDGPLGWGRNHKRREIAEANPRNPEMHAW
jgi:hypothetical protein